MYGVIIWSNIYGVIIWSNILYGVIIWSNILYGVIIWSNILYGVIIWSNIYGVICVHVKTLHKTGKNFLAIKLDFALSILMKYSYFYMALTAT